MAQVVDKDGWIEEVEETKDEWDLVVHEDDDEETIRLKKRLAKAQMELEIEKGKSNGKELSTQYIYEQDASSKDKRRNKNASWAEKLGYDKNAKERARQNGGWLEKHVEDDKTRIVIYSAIIVIAVASVILKFVFF